MHCVFIAVCRLSLVAGSGGSLCVVCRLHTAVTSLVVEHGFYVQGFSNCDLGALEHTGFSSCDSWTLERGLISCGHTLGCSTACGIFLDHGSNLCPLCWQVDSYPLNHQGSLVSFILVEITNSYTTMFTQYS